MSHEGRWSAAAVAAAYLLPSEAFDSVAAWVAKLDELDGVLAVSRQN